MSYSCLIRVLFVSYSCPIHALFVSRSCLIRVLFMLCFTVSFRLDFLEFFHFILAVSHISIIFTFIPNDFVWVLIIFFYARAVFPIYFIHFMLILSHNDFHDVLAKIRTLVSSTCVPRNVYLPTSVKRRRVDILLRG